MGAVARKPRDLQRTGLFVCDAEVARRLGVSQDRLRNVAPSLESDGFPKRDPMMQGRYWPAVVAFWNRRYGVDKVDSSLQPDGEENLDAL